METRKQWCQEYVIIYLCENIKLGPVILTYIYLCENIKLGLDITFNLILNFSVTQGVNDILQRLTYTSKMGPVRSSQLNFIK